MLRLVGSVRVKNKWFSGQSILEYIIIFAVVILATIKFFPQVKTMFNAYIGNAAERMDKYASP